MNKNIILLSDNLEKIMKVAPGLDLKTICNRAGISQATFYAILSRREDLNPRLKTLTAIADGLKIPYYLLFRPTTEEEWREILDLVNELNSKK